MARYDRDFLVPYLEDICSLQLSKQKIHQMIHTAKNEIEYINRSALEKVGTPDLEEYKSDSDLTGMGTGCLGIACFVGAVVTFFMAMISGELGMLIIPGIFAVAEVYLVLKFLGAKDVENAKIKERNDEIERDHAVAQMSALVIVQPQVDEIKKRIMFLEKEIDRVEQLLEKAYSANVIPRWYRDLYPAVYLYDWFANGRADDLDVALNTLVLEQIKDRLDTIIRNQGEQIINQRIIIANQQKAMEQADRHHKALMAKLDRIEASNEDRNMYLSMIEANTAANAFFSAANYLK